MDGKDFLALKEQLLSSDLDLYRSALVYLGTFSSELQPEMWGEVLDAILIKILNMPDDEDTREEFLGFRNSFTDVSDQQVQDAMARHLLAYLQSEREELQGRALMLISLEYDYTDIPLLVGPNSFPPRHSRFWLKAIIDRWPTLSSSSNQVLDGVYVAVSNLTSQAMNWIFRKQPQGITAEFAETLLKWWRENSSFFVSYFRRTCPPRDAQMMEESVEYETEKISRILALVS